ncbi:hypothetical protein GF360_02800 [candidate division WWE3 bacterium]|nr:hypothetical protein [candidate division WWE3 bacterium]
MFISKAKDSLGKKYIIWLIFLILLGLAVTGILIYRANQADTYFSVTNTAIE